LNSAQPAYRKLFSIIQIFTKLSFERFLYLFSTAGGLFFYSFLQLSSGNLLTLQLSTGCRQSPHPSDSQYRHFLHPVDNHAREFNNSQFQIFIGKVIAGYQQRLLLLIVFYLIFNLFNFIIKI